MRLKGIHWTRAGRWLACHGPDRLAPRDPISAAYFPTALGRVRRESSLALADIVGIKRVNDVDGLASGDRVIAAIGGRLRDGLPGARVYRLGGDEFLVEVAALAGDAQALSLGSTIARLAEGPIDGVSSPVRLRVAVDPAPVGADLDGAMRRLQDALSHRAGDGGVVLAGCESGEGADADRAASRRDWRARTMEQGVSDAFVFFKRLSLDGWEAWLDARDRGEEEPRWEDLDGWERMSTYEVTVMQGLGYRSWEDGLRPLRIAWRFVGPERGHHADWRLRWVQRRAIDIAGVDGSDSIRDPSFLAPR